MSGVGTSHSSFVWPRKGEGGGWSDDPWTEEEFSVGLVRKGRNLGLRHLHEHGTAPPGIQCMPGVIPVAAIGRVHGCFLPVAMLGALARLAEQT